MSRNALTIASIIGVAYIFTIQNWSHYNVVVDNLRIIGGNLFDVV